MLISFIIPVYNAEKYLEVSVKSIINSQFTNYEILLINDGSTDNSYEIMKKLSQIYSCVKIHSKLNGGAASARNMGLINASGDYICFVDSDDYIIDGETIIEIENVLLKEEYDLILLDFQGGVNKIKEELNNKDIIALACTTDRLSSPWAKFYKSDILKNNSIKFDESMRTGEDSNFNAAVSKYIQNACYINYEFYYYRHNPVSLTNTFNMDIFNNLIKNFNVKKSILLKTGNFAELKKAFYCYFINPFSFYFLRLYRYDKKKCKVVLEEYKKNEVLNEALENVRMKDFSFKYKVLYLIAKYKSTFLLQILSMLV